jgi:hypothetical protein
VTTPKASRFFPSDGYPADKRPLRALLRQRLFFVWQRSDLLARIQSQQLAHIPHEFLDRAAVPPRAGITTLESQSRFRAERSDFGWLD